MQQNNDTIKCPNSEHANDVKLVCFNEFCKADRLYCMQCMRSGVHVSHSQYQQELSILFEHIENIEKNVKIQLPNQINKWIWLINTSILQSEESDPNIRNLNNNSQIQILNKSSFFSESLNFKQYEQKSKYQWKNPQWIFEIKWKIIK